MKFFSLFLLFSVLLASCSDLSKGEQLAKIEQLNKTVDSIQTVLIENKIDEIDELSIEAESVVSRIKENINSDTLDLKLAKDIDKYMIMFRSIGNLKTVYSQIKKNSKIEKITLIKLERDVDNGNGDRKKYNHYISFESKNVNYLNKNLKKYVIVRKNTIDTYLALHDKLFNYSFDLITK
jgi:hypothetical protein